MPRGGPRQVGFQCTDGRVLANLWSGDTQCVVPCSGVRKNTLRKAKDLVERCGRTPYKISKLKGTKRPERLDPNAKGNKLRRGQQDPVGGPVGGPGNNDDDDDDGNDGNDGPANALPDDSGFQLAQQPLPRQGQPPSIDPARVENELRRDTQQAEQQQVDDAQQADADYLASARATADNVGNNPCQERMGKRAEVLVNTVLDKLPWMEWIPADKILQCRICALGKGVGFKRKASADCFKGWMDKTDKEINWQNLNRHVRGTASKTHKKNWEAGLRAGMTKEQAFEIRR